MPNTKIVVTLGPASDSAVVIGQMMAAGVSVFRLNASHGSVEERAARIHTVRAVAEEQGRQAAILLDLQGPKIRLGKFEIEGCVLESGAEFVITTKPVLGNCACASTNYAKFAQDVKPGNRVLLCDGAVELRAIESDGDSVRFQVISGGAVGSNKGINLPGVQVSAPSLTEKDLADLQFGLAAGIDLLALSFVRTASDVTLLGGTPAGARCRSSPKSRSPRRGITSRRSSTRPMA